MWSLSTYLYRYSTELPLVLSPITLREKPCWITATYSWMNIPKLDVVRSLPRISGRATDWVQLLRNRPYIPVTLQVLFLFTDDMLLSANQTSFRELQTTPSPPCQKIQERHSHCKILPIPESGGKKTDEMSGHGRPCSNLKLDFLQTYCIVGARHP